MGNQACAATRPLAIGPDDLHGLAVVEEVDFRVRQKTRLLANFLRDGDLALGRDAHWLSLFLLAYGDCLAQPFRLNYSAAIAIRVSRPSGLFAVCSFSA